jgi:signal peptidase I
MSERQHPGIREALETVTLVVLMVLAIRVAMQDYRIDGQSMEYTLHNEEFVLVNRAAYLFHAPARGDVIVFEYPLDTRLNYIKRVIAVPGDIISVQGERVIVDGVTLHEPYINRDDSHNPYPSFSNRIITPGEYFVMGDNRDNSSDSRDWGLVPRDDIIGRAMLIYWPLGEDNLGFLPDAGGVFDAVRP